MLFYPKGRVRTDAGGQNRPPLVSVDRTDTAATSKPQVAGLLPTTQIATERGWVPASRLQAGDLVLTFDSGCQPLRAVDLDPPAGIVPGTGTAPVSVPSGALDNRSPMMLMPGQVVLLDSDIAEGLFGDPFALVPAAALVGWRGIEAAEVPGPPALHLRFDRDEIVYAHGAALLLCPIAPGVPYAADDGPGPHRSLPMHAARRLVARLIDIEALPEPPGHGPQSPV